MSEQTFSILGTCFLVVLAVYWADRMNPQSTLTLLERLRRIWRQLGAR